MSDWQPIKTAPRDGTEILASDYDSIDIVSFMESPYGPYPDRGWWTRDNYSFFPVWWLPLPNQPEVES